MKTKFFLIIICLSFVFSSYSQRISELITYDTLVVRKLSDSIAYNAKRQFVFNRSVKRSGRFYVLYKEKTEKDEKLDINVVFHINNVGANRALEIAGIPEYRLETIEGSFLDIFPFWKKYIDLNADPVILSKDSYPYNKRNVTFQNGLNGYYVFQSFNGNWKIQFIEIQSNVGNKL